MSFIPKFKIYNAAGDTVIYAFPLIYSANHPHSENDYVEHTNIRAKGSLMINGGESAWDLILQGVLRSENYEELVEKMDDMEDKISLHTPFLIRIPKTPSTYYEYKIKRVNGIMWDSESLRVYGIHFSIPFRVNSW